MRDIYLCPTDEKTGLPIVERKSLPGPPKSLEEQLRERFKMHCWPDHKVEQEVAAVLAARKARQEAADRAQERLLQR